MNRVLNFFDAVVRSSVNPERAGLTARGLVIGMIPLAIFFASAFNLSLVEADLVQAGNAVASWVATSLVLVGLARKVYVAVRKTIK